MSTLLFGRKRVAIFLSTFLIPGLGQIYLGRKGKGWILMLSTLTALIVMFAKFMMGILWASENIRPVQLSGVMSLELVLKAYEFSKYWLWVGLLILTLTWVGSVWDILRLKDNPIEEVP